jgi:hypothetical protein
MQNKIPLWITACDEQFRPMLKQHFLPSFTSTGLVHSFELKVGSVSSVYGDFGTKQYNESYSKGLDSVLDTIRGNFGRLIVWSDVDLRFYGNLTPEISDLSRWFGICTAQDSPAQACTGFMAFVSTSEVEKFFVEWIELNNRGGWAHAQESYNEILKTTSLSVLRLPDTYWTIGLSGDRCEWTGENLADIPPPPENIRLHHGNFTRGLDKKLALMNEVKSRVEARK